MASDREPHEPACMIAHNLKSKLAAIVGRCDLLNEKSQSIESAKHIAAIREIAESTIKELTEHQQMVEAEKRRSEKLYNRSSQRGVKRGNRMNGDSVWAIQPITVHLCEADT